MMNLTIGWGQVDGINPVSGIGKFKGHQRTDVFTDDELTRLDAELAKEALPRQRDFGLILNTATRESECQNARWENVALKKNIVTISRVERGENHPLVIPLTSGAYKIIEDMLAERGTSPWLFPSPSGAMSGHMEDAQGCFCRLRDSAEITGSDKTIHLLRHTVATKLARPATPLPILQKILNHASAATTGPLLSR
jgi:integrase